VIYLAFEGVLQRRGRRPVIAAGEGRP